MKKIILLLVFIMAFISFHAQPVISIDRKGEALRDFYLSLNVENLWIAGNHVNWQTGEADKPDASSGNHTHCSAFAAAACKRLNIYILRPPDHKQVLLANAQYDWLGGSAAMADGWKLITGNNVYETAQRFSNNGYVVVAICKNPDESKPGHTALVMPDERSERKLADDGPVVIMAGTHNHNKISLKAGFISHLSAWPEQTVSFYYNSNLPGL
jgi:hypothetical protein